MVGRTIRLESRVLHPENLLFSVQRVLFLLLIYPPTGTRSGKILSTYGHPTSPALILFIPDISTTSRSGLTLVFGSRGGRFRATRGIQNWDPVTRTLLHGTHIVSISVGSPIRKRCVVFICWDLSSINMFLKQMSTCSGLSALDHANSKYSKGYATSGIVCTTCRHEFVLPEGAGPLQKGERLVSRFILF